MKLRYLAHSSFIIECGGTVLVFDPWLKGPAYFRQWYLWPVPLDDIEKIKIDAILISHGHEDHLHIPTLKCINHTARIFFPYQWRAGVKPFLNQLGFKEVTEAVSFTQYHVNDVKITYLGYSLESVIVVEHGNEVLVNINDALNSNHETATNFLLKEIKRRWPHITYLLSGWSGASYFPNQIKYPGKDDVETGKLREQYFANNFFRFTNYLQPKKALPFAPGFVLLAEDRKWINHVKFPREGAQQYYTEHFGNTGQTEFIISYPGDEIDNGKLRKRSPLHSLNSDEQYKLAYALYEKETEEEGREEPVSESEIAELIKQLLRWMNYNKVLYHPKVLHDVVFSIRLTDAANTFLNIRWSSSRFCIERAEQPLEDHRLLIHTAARKMMYALGKVWGGDVLTIGYGITIDVYEQLTLEKNLDIVCMRLITRYPMARKDIIKFPFRTLKYYTHNPRLTSLWLKQKVMLRPYVNRYPYNERDHWMTYNKCDLCAVCKMPEINLEAYYGSESQKADHR